MRTNLLSAVQETCNPFGIFSRYNGLRQLIELAVDGEIVAIEQQVRPGGHPENCGGSRFYCTINDSRAHRVLIRKVVPRNQQARMDKQNGAFRGRTSFGESLNIAGANVDNLRRKPAF